MSKMLMTYRGMSSFLQRILYVLLVVQCVSGCSLRDLVDVDASSQTATSGAPVDPKIVQTYSGAISLYYAAIGRTTEAASSHIILTGLMTDELTVSSTSMFSGVDSRSEEELVGTPFNGVGVLFNKLSMQRIGAQQAIGALRQYPTLVSPAYIGEIFALQAMSEIWLAEDYCSGVPLGTAPFSGGFQYTAGLTTSEVLHHALALLDTAEQYGKDSLPILTLTRVARGRAWLNLGTYSRAAEAVAPLEKDSQYLLYYTPAVDNLSIGDGYGDVVMNKEGANGLSWIATDPTMQDVRIPITAADDGSGNLIQQTKFRRSATTVVLASLVEARLIQAEAQLQAPENPQGPWLETLNGLRRTIGLTDLTDPGTASARVDLLFQERAFWLYMTGHRQGDLRRLVRYYGPGRQVRNTYPSGPYPLARIGRAATYGDRITFTPSKSEMERNPLYKGCISRDP